MSNTALFNINPITAFINLDIDMHGLISFGLCVIPFLVLFVSWKDRFGNEDAILAASFITIVWSWVLYTVGFSVFGAFLIFTLIFMFVGMKEILE